MEVFRRILAEIDGQVRVLDAFAGDELPKAPAGSVFVGAGDSYAAALVGFYASGGKCLAVDPYSLASDPRIARGKDVFFISASGRTASNVYAAKAVKSEARSTAALTADEGSPLVEQVSKTFKIPMRYVPKAPGILSFSLSALAVLFMVGGSLPCDFARALRAAKEENIEFSLGRGVTYLLGNSLAYPASIYAAAKVYELLGACAHSELLEEFSHLELFSLRKGDAVNVFGHFDGSGVSTKLATALRNNGYVAHVAPAWGRTGTELFFHCVFLAQLWSVGQARMAGLQRPRFMNRGKQLRISDMMIY
ncbi:MAG: SIS domain-containing protein [Nitrososphaerota archaeon]|nr:SIS domain-containing protein [Nitrososphaerota archaeon]MDG6918161.1 SIS domain-containing protein [Nitrososphaerota archaeon]